MAVAYTHTQAHTHTYALWSNKAASGLFGYNQYFSETISICFFNCYICMYILLLLFALSWQLMFHIFCFDEWNSAKGIKILIAAWNAFPRNAKTWLDSFIKCFLMIDTRGERVLKGQTATRNNVYNKLYLITSNLRLTLFTSQQRTEWTAAVDSDAVKP